MTYRIRNILIAVGLTLVAMLLTLLYVTNVRRSAEHQSASTQIYVAAKDLPAGTSGADIVKQHELRLATVRQADVVPGAISSPSQVDSLVLSAPIYQGEQVTLRRFSDAAAEGIRAQLSGRMRAVQIAGDPNQLLAGTLQAGDHVDVVANLHVSGPNGATGDATRIVLRDLLVLTAPGGGTKVAPTQSDQDAVMLAVSDTQVQRLFFVMKNADWTLELRPVLNATDSPERIETAQTVLNGGAR